MRVLVIGDGASEHALCWKLVESPLVDELACAPGGAGVANLAECVPISMTARDTILTHCDDNEVEFVIVDSIASMEIALVDMLNRNGYPSFGPDMGGVKLESSKLFAKEFCKRNTIPTAHWEAFTDAASAKAYVAGATLPLVVKSDLRVDGAKVVICQTKEDAEAAIDARFTGAENQNVIIEEFLTGQEITYSAITDGNVVLPLTTTTPAWNGDNTPADLPGSLSPAPGVTPELESELVDLFLLPTVQQMKEERHQFRGHLQVNLKLTAEGPKLMDYKVHFSDPEWQVIMLRMKGDLMPALISSFDEMLYRFNPFRWHEESAMAVVVKTDGKRDPEQVCAAVDAAEEPDGDIVVFQSYQDRELGITASGKDLDDVRKRLLAATERLKNVMSFE
ncbi:phosphoribosylamine--glycine ligase [Beijerinckia indica]|uniref:Phosphoribosylamine--glycine ligase n=1 Tax=Beijerinckia indica subsp. indica (strain ATCC 9039 / DSM 1715 / NCIMB 8712) TaxID=395963 RepID=B2IK91_BEII9|nr:phosphoribosylamine--glycine ligase [Beijerinckia indica]ACB95023.1 Phosphoribosylamine--glycine ligase [Beijerinckia indica subsp. indica ATCC 9039]